MRARAAFVVVLFVLGVGAPATARTAASRAAACSTGDVPLFAGAGTPLSNGFFFPGTAVYDGSKFQGAPLLVPQGCNVRFVNLDVGILTNGHEVISFARKRGRPLFKSALSDGPGTEIVRTSKVPPGLYPYFCGVHYGMYGLLQVTASGLPVDRS